MQMEVSEYLALLNKAESMNFLDWNSPEKGVYEHEIGVVTLRVITAENGTKWEIQHPRGGILHKGSSESPSVAHQEMVAYARHWVKNRMAGVLVL